MNDIQIFNNPQFGQIRTALADNGEPMFCAKDVASALGYADTTDAIARHCKSGKKVFHPHANGIGGVNMVFIPEKDLYRLIMRSNLPEAEKFQDWVCDEVLPAIRKHGAYATPQTIESILANPDNGIKLLQALKEERAAKEQAQLQAAQKDKVISHLIPLADFAKTAFTSDTLISISQAAKILRLPFGRNTLFRKLRESGIFFAGKNEPKQRYIDAGYFRLSEGNPIETSKGLMIPVTVYCTQKGLAYINLKFGNKQSTAIPQLAKIY